jgi:subtilisin family serine protease
MSAQISQDMRASGIARVIVILTKTASGKDVTKIRSDLEKHFVTSDLSQATALATSSIYKGIRPPAVRYYPNLGIMMGTVNSQGLLALRTEKDVVADISGAPPISLIRPTRSVAAKLTQKVTWGIAALEVPAVWEQGYTGKGVLVGHLDTGVDGNHPALKDAIADFAEFDGMGREVRPSPKPYDTDEHGTHTAAIIAGRAIRGKAIGVAPGALLASAIVIEGGEVVARVLGGMDWAVGKGVRILNMSLGFRGWWQDFLPLTRLLRQRNILPVLAVGNEGPGTSRSPGNYWQALSVGAFDQHNKVADFSSSQRFKRKKDPVVPDIVAPGVDIISARPKNRYQLMDGTSMATPHISGLAALLWEAKPDATVNQIEQAIFKSCQVKKGIDPERGSRGIPNAPRALAALLNL